MFLQIQLFCDFSGYTDIAIGSSKLLGINLSKNFDNLTLQSKDLITLWQRWHITLTSWFRDYLYRPLVKGLKINRRLALILVFMITGLWHERKVEFRFMGINSGSMDYIGVLGETF